MKLLRIKPSKTIQMCLFLLFLGIFYTPCLSAPISDCPDGAINIVLNGSTYTHPKELVTSPASCTYIFEFEKGEYADLSVKATDLGSGRITVGGMFDTVESEGTNFTLTAAFPATFVILELDAGVGRIIPFEFRIVNKPVNFDLNARTYSVEANKPAAIEKLDAFFYNNWHISTDSSVELVMEASPLTPKTSLMSYHIYSINEAQIKCIGTGSALKSWLKSITGNVTIFQPYKDSRSENVVIIANHPTNLIDCSSYSTQWSYSDSSLTPSKIVLGVPRGEPGCVTILNDFSQSNDYYSTSFYAPYFTKMSLDGDASVIVGAPIANPKSLIDFSSGSNLNSLPQHFAGFARTIMLKSARNLHLELSLRTPEDTIIATNGRSGFEMSENFGFRDTFQSMDFRIKSEDNGIFNFTFYVEESDANATNADIYFKLEVTDGNRVLMDPINLGDPSIINRKFIVQSNQVFLKRTSFHLDDPNTGFLIRYSVSEILKPSTTSTSTTTTTTKKPITSTTTTTTTTTTTPKQNEISTSTTKTTSTKALTTTSPDKGTIPRQTTKDPCCGCFRTDILGIFVLLALTLL